MKSDEKVPMQTAVKASKTFYAHGMFLYGAKWDSTTESIVDLSPNDPTGNEVPTIQMQIVEFNPLGAIDINGEKVSNVGSHYVESDSFCTDSSMHSE